jgi:hypothetical protein
VTATLRIEIDPGPIERARADLAVVGLYAAERPLRGATGRADWRLCGRLSQLVASGRLQGARGEAVLAPTRGGLRAPLLITLGLGPREGFQAGTWEAIAAEAVERGLKLGATAIALPLPDGEVGDFALLQRVEALVTGAARALAGRSGELCLRVVAGRGEAARVAEAVRSARPRGLPAPVALRLPAPPDRRRVAAHQPGAQDPTAPQLLK